MTSSPFHSHCSYCGCPLRVKSFIWCCSVCMALRILYYTVSVYLRKQNPQTVLAEIWQKRVEV